MKLSYPLLALLSMSLVVAGPLPVKRNIDLIKRTEQAIKSASSSAPVTALTASPAPSAENVGAEAQKAAEEKAGESSLC